MSIAANQTEILQKYASGVMGRAEHHADNVKAICLAILGAVIWRSDLHSIEIKQYDGNLANVLWFEVDSKRYAIAYNHDTDKIEIRDRTQSGPPLTEFDNSSSALEIQKFFSDLPLP